MSVFEDTAQGLFVDPWQARNEYIDVILEGRQESVDSFLSRNGRGRLVPPQRVTALQLMELQRHAMLMYTSCSWFFEDISGLEAVQSLRHAARALQLARSVSAQDFEDAFVRQLEDAPCNSPEYGNGRGVYDKLVRPETVSLQDVGAHYATTLLLGRAKEQQATCNYEVRPEGFNVRTSDAASLGCGRIHVLSRLTSEEGSFTCGLVYRSPLRLDGGIRDAVGETSSADTAHQVLTLFEDEKWPELINTIKGAYGHNVRSLAALLGDDRLRIVSQLLVPVVLEVTTSQQDLSRMHPALMSVLQELGVYAPPDTLVAALLGEQLLEALDRPEPDLACAIALIHSAGGVGAPLDAWKLGVVLQSALSIVAKALIDHPVSECAVARMEEALALWRAMPSIADIGDAQRAVYVVLRAVGRRMLAAARGGDERAQEWFIRMSALAETLNISINHVSARQ